MGTSSAPVFPYPGGTPGAQPPNPVAGQAGHFEWSNWIKQFVLNLDAQSAKTTGETFTGVLESVVNAGSFNLKLRYDGSPGITLRGTTGGLDVRNATGSARATTSVATPTAPEHAATKEYVDAVAQDALISALPTGSIVMYASATPPSGWILCNGQSTTGYPALAAVVGANVPDLRDRFVIGNSTGRPLKSTGGAEQVTLTANQSGVPAHSHGVTVNNADAVHYHTVNPGPTASTAAGSHSHGGGTGSANRNQSHGHTATIKEGITTGDSIYYIDTADEAVGHPPITTAVIISATNTDHEHGISADGNHSHSVDIAQFNSGSSSVSHSHSGSAGNNTAAGAVAPHDNIPPYYALAFIIKAV
jgi:microcystin-dependent protein